MDPNIAAFGVPLLPLASSGLAELAEIIGAFLIALRRRFPPSSDCGTVCKQLEHLQKRLSSVKDGEMTVLLTEDNKLLDAVLMLFSVFLYLEVPESEEREIVIAGLWDIREQLAYMRRHQSLLN